MKRALLKTQQKNLKKTITIIKNTAKTYDIGDKELVELLYFDAKLTQKEFTENISMNSSLVNEIRVRFVATQGGLTRWQTYPEEEEDQSFGEKFGKALDEVWYKSAVLLHEKHSPKFVFSIPQNFNFKNKVEKFITATHAIFYNEDDNEAPGAVVGFQISFDFLRREIQNVPACSKNATENRWDCYVIDSNGFIIYSPIDDEIGKFFGTVVGGAAAMIQMVDYKIFRKISMFDYQALERTKGNDTTSSSSAVSNPLNFVTLFINWSLSGLVWFLIQVNLWQYIGAADSCTVGLNSSSNTTCSCKSRNRTCPICCKAPRKYADSCQTREVLPHIETDEDFIPKEEEQPVDKQFSLFLYTNLSATRYTPRDKYNPSQQCSRPFHAARMNKTNLILLLVDTLHETCESYLNIEQKVVQYESMKGDESGSIPACHKKMINSYPRKKLRGCSDKIIQNRTKEVCGNSYRLKSNHYLQISGATFLIIFFTSVIT